MAKKNEAGSPGTEIAELSPDARAAQALSFESTKEKLVALAKRSTPIVAITNDDGLAEAKAALGTLVSHRTAIAKTGKAARDGALKFQKAVIAKEKELIEVIRPEEERLGALVSAEEARRDEAERVAREEEQRRAELIQKAFARVRSLPELAKNSDVAGIGVLIAEAEKLRDDPSAIPEDLRAAAVYEAKVAINACKAARDAREKADADAAELAELRRERAEREAREKRAAEESAAEQTEAMPEVAEAPARAAEQTEAVRRPEPPRERRHVDLLCAAKAALVFLRARGFANHQAAVDLADAIDDADVPGGAS